MASPSSNSGQGFRKLFTAGNVTFNGAFQTPAFIPSALPSLYPANAGLQNAGQVIVDIGDAPNWQFFALRFFGAGGSGKTA